MKGLASRITKVLPHSAKVSACDNSGAKEIKIFAVRGHKTVKGRLQAAGVGDLIWGSVVSGNPDMRKKVVLAVIARQKKSFRRSNGMRVKFEDNAAIVLKDEKGNPKGTMIKGPIPKEVAEKWPAIAKIATIIV